MLSLAACYSACRYIHIAAIMQAFGMALFCEYLAPSGLRGRLRAALGGTIRIMAWIAMLSAVALLALQAGQMGDGWTQTRSPAVWQAVLGTSFGAVWQWHLPIALAAVSAAGFGTITALRHRLLLAAMAGLLSTQALVGHTAMSEGLRGLLQRLNQIVHLFSAAWWLGGLLPLMICLPLLRQSPRQDALQALIRFSRSGHFAVALVILSGMANTALVLGQWPVDWSAPYQRLLLIKITVVMVMVILAVTNRYGVVPAMARHHPAAIRILTLITLAEMILGNLVLLLVSIFATFEP
ncbi:copper homeostasis membrane protein CopD [Acerihabitans arboris]|uniref:Copper resistance protein D n=1 Tax=Acerihabitans arboris TaxID=2691583 RepID=A0A845SCP7_9GAMM|nr:copper homeostasis membrane protein CopD [Acerihabitans arboris]NDL62540.1 copper homeostasis membrane protein CopD [Acerihabitans arboris]